MSGRRAKVEKRSLGEKIIIRALHIFIPKLNACVQKKKYEAKRLAT